nr:MAG TPA: hypothetical protein [Caudoviricetes sp.]
MATKTISIQSSMTVSRNDGYGVKPKSNFER